MVLQHSLGFRFKIFSQNETAVRASLHNSLVAFKRMLLRVLIGESFVKVLIHLLFHNILVLTIHLVAADCTRSVDRKGMRFRHRIFSRVSGHEICHAVVAADFVRHEHEHRMPIFVYALDLQISGRRHGLLMFMFAACIFGVADIAADHADALIEIMFFRSDKPLLDALRLYDDAAVQTDRLLDDIHRMGMVFLTGNPIAAVLFELARDHHVFMGALDRFRLHISADLADPHVIEDMDFFDCQLLDDPILDELAAIVAFDLFVQETDKGMSPAVRARRIDPGIVITDVGILDRLMLMVADLFLMISAEVASTA